MSNVQLRYGEDTPVLKNISCVFKSQEKVINQSIYRLIKYKFGCMSNEYVQFGNILFQSFRSELLEELELERAHLLLPSFALLNPLGKLILMELTYLTLVCMTFVQKFRSFLRTQYFLLAL